MAKTKTLVGQVREVMGAWVDTVGRNKAGNIVLRRGFYFTNGMTASKLGQAAVKLLAEAGITATMVDSFDIWKPFKGGASVAQGSHFYVELAIDG